MPVIGAIIDYTPHRRKVGYITASLIVLMQVGTFAFSTESLWLVALITNAVLRYFLEVVTMVFMAYYPEIARKDGEAKMSKSKFYYTNRYRMYIHAYDDFFLLLSEKKYCVVFFSEIFKIMYKLFHHSHTLFFLGGFAVSSFHLLR